MKEKNDELINNLLRSKFNWWNRFWNQLIKIVKVKSKDSSYQASLVSIREDVVRKNSKEDSKEDPAYQVYLDRVKDYLETNGKCLLTEQEEEVVVAHLNSVTATFCNKHSKQRNDAASYDGLGITQVLSIETAKKVSELHPDFPMPTEVRQRVKEVLAVQNYLNTSTPEKHDT